MSDSIEDTGKEINGIRSWAEEDRPREKLMLKGSSVLSDAELLAILIGSGTPGESAVDLCKSILKDAHNNLNDLGKFSVADLKKYKGIGEAKAITIVAALELAKRRRTAEVREKEKNSGQQGCLRILSPPVGLAQRGVLGDVPQPGQ